MDKVNAAEKLVDGKLSDAAWLNSNVEIDGARRRFWLIHIDGYFSELERGELCQRYRDAGWGYVTTQNGSPSSFDLELIEKELKR